MAEAVPGTRREWSVRARLLALALSIALPAALALGLAAVEGWRVARARTDGVLLARAEALASAVARELAQTRATLEALAAAPALAADDLEAFRRQVDALPLSRQERIVLTRSDGRMVVNSRFPQGTELPLHSDLDPVRRVFATGQPQVSDLYMGAMTREHFVSVDVPVRGGDGAVRYDLSMGLVAASLVQVLTEQALPAGWRATLLDGRGTIVARSHGAAEFIGHPTMDEAMVAIRVGASPFDSPSQEGRPVRAAHAAVPGTGWAALVAVPREELSAPLRAGLRNAAFTGGGLLLLGLLGAVWQGRRIAMAFSDLADGAEALGRGAAPPRPPRGVAEAGPVGAALSAAARGLAAREAERADADRRQDILIAELNHRVKNTLATVQAIAAQTLRRDGGETALSFADLDHRLRALARAHDLLVAGTWSDTPLPVAVRAALAPWTETGRLLVGCDCGDRQLRLRPSQTQALVLALHELATNAAKYGALSRGEGRVLVRCMTEPGAEGGRVEWEERGGPPIPADLSTQRKGFGTRLLERALPREMGPGSTVALDFAPSGLRAAIRIGGADA